MSLSFSQFCQNTYCTAQPQFSDFLHIQGRTVPLINVQWIKLDALGDEAIKINTWINDFQRWFTECHRQRVWSPFPLLYKNTLDDIYKKLNTTEPAQAIRRAAAGFCSIEELIKLLDTHPMEVNTSDQIESKRFTPLHIALDNDKDEIAIVLIKKGASLQAFDAKKRTPYQCFQAAKEDSQIKKNTTLINLMK